VLIVAEALHGSAAEDVAALMKTLSEAVAEAWGVTVKAGVMSAQERRFTI